MEFKYFLSKIKVESSEIQLKLCYAAAVQRYGYRTDWTTTMDLHVSEFKRNINNFILKERKLPNFVFFELIFLFFHRLDGWMQPPS
jgi:hypothetical protein